MKHVAMTRKRETTMRSYSSRFCKGRNKTDPDVADSDADESGPRHTEWIQRQRVCTLCD